MNVRLSIATVLLASALSSKSAAIVNSETCLQEGWKIPSQGHDNPHLISTLEICQVSVDYTCPYCISVLQYSVIDAFTGMSLSRI